MCVHALARRHVTLQLNSFIAFLSSRAFLPPLFHDSVLLADGQLYPTGGPGLIGPTTSASKTLRRYSITFPRKIAIPNLLIVAVCSDMCQCVTRSSGWSALPGVLGRSGGAAAAAAAAAACMAHPTLADKHTAFDLGHVTSATGSGRRSAVHPHKATGECQLP